MIRRIALYGGGLLLVILGAWWVIGTILGQADTIAAQREQISQRDERIESLGRTLEQQHQQYQQDIAARDSAVEAQRQQAQAASQRAESLADVIDQSRVESGDVDACMGMQLPDAIADGLRQ